MSEPSCDFPRDEQGRKIGEGCAVHGYLDLPAGVRCPDDPTKKEEKTSG